MIAAVLGSSLLALAVGWLLGMWTRKRGLANPAHRSSTVEDAS
jgi:hypothetical protein